MNTLIVESPAKAKTINKYLGSNFTVLASFGHVRDLPSKDGYVVPEENFLMRYQISPAAKKYISEISKSVKKSDILYLATDPDREGESISWHVVESLREMKSLPKNIEIKRVVFSEITKKAVQKAVANPREIDMNLVNAQQARRALDYLVGFNLSPVLWRKLPGSRSAGRVQSVALRMLCERDSEIEIFKPVEYWDIKGIFHNSANKSLEAKLVEFDGEKLEKLSITNKNQAEDITKQLKTKNYNAQSIRKKQIKRNPPSPFTTSSLQQEAFRKLGFSTKKTMMIAQRLYEGTDINNETTGLITYMRTDGVTVSEEAINKVREVIPEIYSKEYLPDVARVFVSKIKNAQEAHEAIRPTEPSRIPKNVEEYLSKDELVLYELIWKRFTASQMSQALIDQTSIDIASNDNKAMLRASGSVIQFDGFLTLYNEGKDDVKDEDSKILPKLSEGEDLSAEEINPAQHFTEPPPRYTEASLVKKLEEMGIGRPSTYSSIISVLTDRNYAEITKKRFFATSLCRITNAFLVNYFTKYVEYDFTAGLEEQLDKVSSGDAQWTDLLKTFWVEFSKKIDESKQIKNSDIIDALDKFLSPYIFPEPEDGSNPRVCPSCKKTTLGLRTGKFGAFVGCSNYPDCKHTKAIFTGEKPNQEEVESQFTDKLLGNHPELGNKITLKKGPYGFYVELETTDEKSKPKRSAIPKNIKAENVDLEKAVMLLSLPREVGKHPETGEMITASIGRYGPYLRHNNKFHQLKDDDILTIGINRAVDVIADDNKRKKTKDKTNGKYSKRSSKK